MFEKEIQTAKQQLSSHLLTDEIYVYLHEVLSKPEVPGFYKTFFCSEVDWWIYEQRMLREVNPRFNFADAEFGATLQEFDRHCRRTARFDHAELTGLIDLAVKTRVNYLLRPRTTLKWFIYRGEPTKPLREVLLRLAYFDCYDYLTGEFRRWADAKLAESQQQDILSVIEFERLIENIDNDIILEHTTSEFTQLLAPLYEFFNEVQPPARRDAIPTPALIIFLDDKGILRISQELERLMKENDLDVISRDQFLRVIDDVITQVEDEAQPEYMDMTTIPLDFDKSSGRKHESVPLAMAEESEQGGEAQGEEPQAEDAAPAEQMPGAEQTEDTAVEQQAVDRANDESEPAETAVREEHELSEVVATEAEHETIATEADHRETERATRDMEELSGDSGNRETPDDIPVFSLRSAFFQDTVPGDEDAEPAGDEISGDSVLTDEADGLSRALAELSVASAVLREESQAVAETGEEESAPAAEAGSVELSTGTHVGAEGEDRNIVEPLDTAGVTAPVAEVTADAVGSEPGGGERIGGEPDEAVSIAEAELAPVTAGTQEDGRLSDEESTAAGASAGEPSDEPAAEAERPTPQSDEQIADIQGGISQEETSAVDATETDPASFYVPGEQVADAPDAAPEEPVVTELTPEPEVVFFSIDDVRQEIPPGGEHAADGGAGTQADVAATGEDIPALVAYSGPPLKRVEDLIDDNVRQRVLKHIFHKNESRFRSVIERLNRTHSWREASAIIDRVFAEHEVDPYSSIARKFSDIVYERFLTG